MKAAMAAELRKLATLPACAIGAAICLLGTLAVVVLNANAMRSAMDRGDTTRFRGIPLSEFGLDATIVGVIGAVVLGVVVVSSEYTATRDDAGGSRQIVVSLTAVPRRGVLLTAKVLVLTTVVALLGSLAVPGALLLSQLLLGRHGRPAAEVFAALGWRPVGAVLFWVLTALLAAAITVFTRSGIVPMALLITNCSVVSFSFLLTKVTDLAMYLPDVAGAQMFTTSYPAASVLPPVTGGAVMAAWAIGLLLLAGYVLQRRDG